MDGNSPRPHRPEGGDGHIEQVIRDLYLGKRHSDQEIADALGVNRVTVTKWRKRWGIARDDRPPVEIS
jgi:transposase-like protein